MEPSNKINIPLQSPGLLTQPSLKGISEGWERYANY